MQGKGRYRLKGWRREGVWGGGNSLSGADSGLSFEREEGSLCEEWRWNETSEGEAGDVTQRAAIRLAQRLRKMVLRPWDSLKPPGRACVKSSEDHESALAC